LRLFDVSECYILNAGIILAHFDVLNRAKLPRSQRHVVRYVLSLSLWAKGYGVVVEIHLQHERLGFFEFIACMQYLYYIFDQFIDFLLSLMLCHLQCLSYRLPRLFFLIDSFSLDLSYQFRVFD
jgi:hypothetical protein